MQSPSVAVEDASEPQWSPKRKSLGILFLDANEFTIFNLNEVLSVEA